MALDHAATELPVVIALDGSAPLAETLAAAREAGLRVRCVDELLQIVVGRIPPDQADAVRAVAGIKTIEIEHSVHVTPPDSSLLQ